MIVKHTVIYMYVHNQRRAVSAASVTGDPLGAVLIQAKRNRHPRCSHHATMINRSNGI